MPLVGKRGEEMPTATIELPRDMVAAAQSYAARERKSVARLFMELFAKAYRYSMPDIESPRLTALRRVADENAPQWLNDISGVVSLPSEKSDADLICEAIADKYGEVR